MKLRPFELGLIVIFVVLFFGALVLMSTYSGGGSSEEEVVGEVTIWGLLPQRVMDEVLLEIRDADNNFTAVSYREIPLANFNNELVNAIADETGPDMIIISHEQLVEMRRRIQAVSFDSVPLRDIRSTYLDGAQIFALNDGLYAYPLLVDPLVMYWNRDIVTSEGLLEAPETWEALVNEYVPTLVRRNPDRSIVRAVVALGEYTNVKQAFPVLSMLLLQAGTQGITEQDSLYQIRLNQSAQSGEEPLRIAADFYTRFSRPNNSLYSWNRSYPSDLDAFLSGELVFYFGYASEGRELEQRNPNLNFDVAEVPQGAAATVRRTYGNFYGLSVLRTSDNLPGATAVLAALTASPRVTALAEKSGMVPADRALVAAGSNDTYGRIAYLSAPVAFGWLNPRRPAVDSIFETMTNDINQNRRDSSGAVADALGRFELEYNSQ